MEFQDLIQVLHNSSPQPNPNYYRTLIDNAQTIVLEVAKRNQHLVAKDLGMDRMKLSHLLPLLKEVM